MKNHNPCLCLSIPYFDVKLLNDPGYVKLTGENPYIQSSHSFETHISKTAINFPANVPADLQLSYFLSCDCVKPN